MLLHHIWLTYFVKSNYENNLHSLDIMQSFSGYLERGLWETRQQRNINHTMCWSCLSDLIGGVWLKAKGATRLLIPAEQRSVTPSYLLKCHTAPSCQDGSMHSTRQWSVPCRSLGPLIPKLVLSLSPLILINETFSLHKKIWEMTAVLVLESEIAPRGCVNIVA